MLFKAFNINVLRNFESSQHFLNGGVCYNLKLNLLNNYCFACNLLILNGVFSFCPVKIELFDMFAESFASVLLLLSKFLYQ